MNKTVVLTRFLLSALLIFFLTFYFLRIPKNSFSLSLLEGILTGGGLSLLFFSLENWFKKATLRTFNTLTLGLFFGLLMGKGLNLIFNETLQLLALFPSSPFVGLMEIAFFLFGLYFGTFLTLQAADKLYLSIPFVKFSATTHKKKDLLIDSSILLDARIIDLAASGLIDNHLVIPRFIVKDLYAQGESGDENSKIKARRALENLKKLEEFSGFEIRYLEGDFPELKEQVNKLIKLARQIDANLLTADISKVQMAAIEGIKIINLQTLANAFKPLMSTGEILKIKIQRYGKEPNQGVGYLEDGTMVVVNGGGDFIGQNIASQVLSVKHTTSGRIIFCNVLEENASKPAYSLENTYE